MTKKAKRGSKGRAKRVAIPDRGFIEYNPTQRKMQARLEMVKEIVETYHDELPVTVRQIFYIACGRHGYEKTENGYNRLGGLCRKARRGRHIDMDAIRDDGIHRDEPRVLALDAARSMVSTLPDYLRCDRQFCQPRRLMVICEAAGMIPQLARVAGPYGIPVQSSGGYDSITAKHGLAVEIAKQGPSTILHIGDMDPSGEDMMAVLTEDVRAFCAAYGAGDCLDVVRVAVTERQVEDLNLETAPPKKSDTRTAKYGRNRGTVQAEAIPPDVMRQILKDAIDERIDTRRLLAMEEIEEIDRERLKRDLARFEP